jgi:hypothetical protein
MATLLSSGKMLVVGRYNFGEPFSSSALLHNPATDRIVPKSYSENDGREPSYLPVPFRR